MAANHSAAALPRVTVVIPTFNEGPFISECLRCVVSSDYPSELIEVLVVDGGSKDITRSLVEDIARADPRVRLLDNPRRNSSAGLNVGIFAAKGDVLIRVDAHARYAGDYIRESVSALELAPDVGSAAGLQIAEGNGYWQGTVAAAMGHPFGAGDAKYRHSLKPAWVDTVFLGAWRRDVAQALGGFDPEWKINADYEFNIRLRKAGYRLYLSPKIRSVYYPRSSPVSLARQYFKYGYWRARTVYAHPRYARWRQFVPPGFTLGLIFGAVVAPTTGLPLALMTGSYAIAALAASLQAASRTSWTHLPLLPVVFATMHLNWGAGFLAGALRWAPVAGRLRRQKACSPSGPRELLNKSGTI